MLQRCIGAFLILALAGAAGAAEAPGRDAALFNSLPARNIGPATMGGRIVDIDAVESNPKIMYVAAASGGLWKTTDGGDSWVPLFDAQTTLCLGDVTVSQSSPDVVWVGTGEVNPRNSVSWGDGVYKSTDGGKTWQNMGLKESHHVGRIIIHPKNPDVVWVAALGHLWGPNKERGVYKTIDGGKTWAQSKFIDENTGFVDLAIDPEEPDILYAAAYCVRRDGFSGGNPRTEWGPGAGLFRTADGGKTWERMTEGLPTREYGRCGLAVWRKDPKVVYAVVQTDRTSKGTAGQAAGNKLDVEAGGVFRSDDKGRTWTKLNDLVPRPFYYGQIRIDPNDVQRIYVLGVQFHVSNDGGKTFPAARRGGGGGGTSVHPDHHALWINPNDSNQVVLGNDGGLYFSKDKAATWEAIRNLPIAQFYGIGVDMRKPFRVVGGLQDNGTWGGPSANTNTEGITTAHWKRLGSADGFQAMIDPTEPSTIYYESQYGGFQRLDLYSGQSRAIRPRPDRGQPAYRFNWNSPMHMSPHNAATVYYGGNHLFKSTNRGDQWERLGSDLTRGGPNNYNGHTLSTIAESPVKAGVIYAGTDDGKVWVTADAGATWTDLSKNVPGVAEDRWITRVECSHSSADTAYLAISRYRNDDRKPYLFRTTDQGKTWKSIAGNLPDGAPVNVVRESSRNANLLFAGTEFGLFGSPDGGAYWHRITNGLPPYVTVHDLIIHPRDHDLVIGTHGRSIYVMEAGPLEEATPAVLAADAHLFDVEPAVAWKMQQPETPTPPRQYRASNPPYGAAVYYHLGRPSAEPVTVTVKDSAGRTLATLDGPKEAGLHRVNWDLRESTGRARQAGGGQNPVGPGEYRVVLRGGGRELSGLLRVEAPY